MIDFKDDSFSLNKIFSDRWYQDHNRKALCFLMKLKDDDALGTYRHYGTKKVLCVRSLVYDLAFSLYLPVFLQLLKKEHNYDLLWFFIKRLNTLSIFYLEKKSFIRWLKKHEKLL